MLTGLYAIALRINSILLALLFASVGGNALTVFLVLNFQHQEIAPSVIGWVMSGYAIGVLLGSRFGYLLIGRSGHFRGYATAAAVVLIATSFHIFVGDLWLVFFLRFTVGIALGMLYLILESWLNATSEHHSRATVFGLYQVFYSLGLLLSPFLATLYDASDIHSFSLIILAFALSIIPLMLTRFPSPQLTGTQKGLPIVEMLRDTPSGAVMAIIAGVAYISISTLLPLFALCLELDKGQIAIMLALATGSSIAFQVPVGKLADRFDERYILLGLAIIYLLSALASYLFAQLHFSWWVLVLPVVFFGGCSSTIYPVCIKFIFNQMDSEKAIPAMSSLSLLFGNGLILGPVLGTSVMQLLNPSGLFVFLSGLMAVAVVFMICRVRVSRFPASDAENIPYVIAVQMVRPINSNLDPRTDYLITRVNNSSIQALANSISISPTKTKKLIEQSLSYFEGYQPEELLEALVMIKPRYSKRIIKAMLLFYPDKTLAFTRALGDLISLNKTTINGQLWEGLTHAADEETRNNLAQLFDEYIQPVQPQEEHSDSGLIKENEKID